MKASKAISSRPARSGGARARTASSSSTDRRFLLEGPSRPVDGRIHAWRKDLADIGLAGHIFAPHYALPLARGCGAHASRIWPRAAGDGEAVSELLPGETFAVLEYAGGWAWGFSGNDHIVGYVEAIALVDPVDATHVVCEREAPVTSDASVSSPVIATHVVCEREAPVTSNASVSSPVIATLPMGSRLHGGECGACLTTEYGCVPLSHLRRIGDLESDPVVVAERMIGAPFLAGGRTAHGLDGPALVQLALSLCGVAAPRLLDHLPALGTAIAKHDPARRGDLVLFDGGAGLMIDDLLMIHAGRAAGKVAVEPAALYATERRRLPL